MTGGAIFAWDLPGGGSSGAGLLFFYTACGGFHPGNPNTPININNIYGFNDQRPQTWMNQNLYVALWLGALWLIAFLPTHLVLRKIFVAPHRVST